MILSGMLTPPPGPAEVLCHGSGGEQRIRVPQKFLQRFEKPFLAHANMFRMHALQHLGGAHRRGTTMLFDALFVLDFRPPQTQRLGAILF